jgi:hypothetical protein
MRNRNYEQVEEVNRYHVVVLHGATVTAL